MQGLRGLQCLGNKSTDIGYLLVLLVFLEFLLILYVNVEMIFVRDIFQGFMLFEVDDLALFAYSLNILVSPDANCSFAAKVSWLLCLALRWFA